MTPSRILVTRSPHQSSALAAALRALGMEPVLLPTIELVEPTSFAPLDNAILHLEEFQWLLFTSANAIDAFVRRGGLRAAGKPKIAAIGPATSRALGDVGLRADLVPAQAVAESLAESLLPFARQADGSPARFLLIRAEDGRQYLPNKLRAAGGEVTIAPAYRTVIPVESITEIRALFIARHRWPDAITFTSSSTATNLLALLEVAGIALPSEVLRVSIGPITSQTLRDAGYPPHAEATMPTIAHLSDAVVLSLTLKDPVRLTGEDVRP